MTKSIVFLAIILSFLFFTPIAEAALYECLIENKKTFQDRPCPGENAKKQKTSALQAQVKGVHSSWLKNPKFLLNNYSCNEKQCECTPSNGRTVIQYYSTPQYDLVTPLRFLSINWARHLNNIKRLRTSPILNNAKERKKFKNKLEGSACSVKLQQEILIKMHSINEPILFERLAKSQEAQKELSNKCGNPTKNTKGESAERRINCTSQNKNLTIQATKLAEQTSKLKEEWDKYTEQMKKPVELLIKK